MATSKTRAQLNGQSYISIGLVLLLVSSIVVGSITWGRTQECVDRNSTDIGKLTDALGRNYVPRSEIVAELRAIRREVKLLREDRR